jgi:hypothetical protein
VRRNPPCPLWEFFSHSFWDFASPAIHKGTEKYEEKCPMEGTEDTVHEPVEGLREELKKRPAGVKRQRSVV